MRILFSYAAAQNQANIVYNLAKSYRKLLFFLFIKLTQNSTVDFVDKMATNLSNIKYIFSIIITKVNCQ